MISHFLERFPRLYLRLAALSRRFPDLAVKRDTELVIEGFGGSANSFAVIAFESAQPRQVRIAHHLHIGIQIIQACRWNIPVLMLIRQPRDAIVSVSTRFPNASIEHLLESYIHFYNCVWPYRTGIVIGTFEDVTTDYGRIIEQLNSRFNTRFFPFIYTAENIKACFSKLEAHTKSELLAGRTIIGNAGIAAATPTSRSPSDIAVKREELNFPKYLQLVSEAEVLYYKWMNYHQSIKTLQ